MRTSIKFITYARRVNKIAESGTRCSEATLNARRKLNSAERNEWLAINNDNGSYIVTRDHRLYTTITRVYLFSPFFSFPPPPPPPSYTSYILHVENIISLMPRENIIDRICHYQWERLKRDSCTFIASNERSADYRSRKFIKSSSKRRASERRAAAPENKLGSARAHMHRASRNDNNHWRIIIISPRRETMMRELWTWLVAVGRSRRVCALFSLFSRRELLFRQRIPRIALPSLLSARKKYRDVSTIRSFARGNIIFLYRAEDVHSTSAFLRTLPDIFASFNFIRTYFPLEEWLN